MAMKILIFSVLRIVKIWSLLESITEKFKVWNSVVLNLIGRSGRKISSRLRLWSNIFISISTRIIKKNILDSYGEYGKSLIFYMAFWQFFGLKKNFKGKLINHFGSSEVKVSKKWNEVRFRKNVILITLKNNIQIYHF